MRILRLAALAQLAWCPLLVRAAVVPLRIQHPGASTFFEQSDTGRFLKRIDEELSALLPIVTEADWGYATNLTDANRELATAAQLRWNKKYLSFVNESRQYLNRSDLTEDQKRQLFYLRLDGSGTPSDLALQEKLSKLIAKMTDIYSTANRMERRYRPKDES